MDQALVGDFHEGVRSVGNLLGMKTCLQVAPRGLFGVVMVVMGF